MEGGEDGAEDASDDFVDGGEEVLDAGCEAHFRWIMGGKWILVSLEDGCWGCLNMELRWWMVVMGEKVWLMIVERCDLVGDGI